MAEQHPKQHQDQDESRPAGNDAHGRAIPAQPSSNDQSGSAGRRTPTPGTDPGKDTGQDRYGQSGLGGKQKPETDGQRKYRQSGPDGGDLPDPDSNEGSSRTDP